MQLTPKPEVRTPDDLRDLYIKFDGVGGDTRIAWYGQCRAQGMTHQEAIDETFRRFVGWCHQYWPVRGIELPDLPVAG